MYAALRTVSGIIVGMIFAFVLVVAVELFSSVVHPVPEDFGNTMEEMCRHVEQYPQWILALVVPAWAAAALVGTWTARRIGNLWSFAVVGLLLMAALVCNISMLPYPLWFKIANLIAVPVAIAAAGRMAARNKTAPVGELP